MVKPMIKTLSLIITALSSLGFSILVHADPILRSVLTNNPPQIGGLASDEAWNKAPVLTTHDPIANIDIHIQSVYDDNSISMLVKFADDLQLDTLTSYYFGVSRYKIAGRESKTELFRAGEIAELIKLNFRKK